VGRERVASLDKGVLVRRGKRIWPEKGAGLVFERRKGEESRHEDGGKSFAAKA